MIVLETTNRDNSEVQNVKDKAMEFKVGEQKQSMKILAASIA